MSKKSFTLVELLIVIMIIAILAAASIPIMRRNVRRALTAEAIATLGMIRRVEKAYYVEYGNYRTFSIGAPVDLKTNQLRPLGLTPADLDGTYFSNECYAALSSGTIFCLPYYSTSPKNGEVRNLLAMFIYTNGYIYNPN